MIKILSGRQHYLRFEIPITWQSWEDNGLEIDSTLGYAEMEGFRCGTCYEYTVYNFITRKKLRLKENPLIFMEVSVMDYQNIRESEKFLVKLRDMVRIAKKYKGNFVFLYHNTKFDKKYFTKKVIWR